LLDEEIISKMTTQIMMKQIQIKNQDPNADYIEEDSDSELNR